MYSCRGLSMSTVRQRAILEGKDGWEKAPARFAEAGKLRTSIASSRHVGTVDPECCSPDQWPSWIAAGDIWRNRLISRAIL